MKNVLTAKNRLLGGLKTRKIAPKSKNAIFSKSKIMIPQSNLGKRKVKLMLVRPKKGFTITTAVFEKISHFYFFELYNGISVQKAQESGKDGNRKSKFEIFSKTAVVIVKPF